MVAAGQTDGLDTAARHPDDTAVEARTSGVTALLRLPALPQALVRALADPQAFVVPVIVDDTRPDTAAALPVMKRQPRSYRA